MSFPLALNDALVGPEILILAFMAESVEGGKRRAECVICVPRTLLADVATARGFNPIWFVSFGAGPSGA
ncbi:MAG: hypothetical protein HY774_06465 [Acidobacteria bacterium]|nr:hypothetical protein [Acidobacteriota bacterium]